MRVDLVKPGTKLLCIFCTARKNNENEWVKVLVAAMLGEGTSKVEDSC